LSRSNDVDASIPLPAGSLVLLANRLFLAVAEDFKLIGDQVLLGGPGTPVAKGDVIFGGTSLIGMTLDG
jgi:hypothetical protein